MLYISRTFTLPILFIVGGAGISAIVSMPKAAVYKNSNMFFRENKIRMPFNGIIPLPSDNMK